MDDQNNVPTDVAVAMHTRIAALGQQATQLLEGPGMDGLRKEVRMRLFNEWFDTKPDETQKREDLYFISRGFNGYDNVLREIQNAGVVAEAKLKEIRKPRIVVD